MRSKCSNSSRQQNNESFSISQMSLGSGEWMCGYLGTRPDSYLEVDGGSGVGGGF